MTIQFSEADRKKLRSRMRKAFPDSPADKTAVESFAVAAWLVKTTITGVDLVKYAPAIDARAKALGLTTQWNGMGTEVRAKEMTAVPAVRYYRVSATHDREQPDFMPFTGHLNMVRVTLPDSQPKAIKTRVGEVIPRDHLMA